MTKYFTDSQTTRILWEGEFQEAQRRFEAGLIRYPYLQEPKYSHKKEQLYLLTLQGFTDSFLQLFFEEDLNIRSQDLDVLRSLALFTGEEACLQYFYKKEFSLAQARTFLEEWFALKRFQQLPKLDALIAERELLQKKASEQLKLLEQDGATRKGWNTPVGLERSQEIPPKQETTQKWNPRSTKERLTQSVNSPKPFPKNRLLLFCLKRKATVRERKEHFRRQKGVLKLLTNPAYNTKQLEVLIQGFQNGLPLKELKRIGDPALTAENMERLEAFLRTKTKEELHHAGTL